MGKIISLEGIRGRMVVMRGLRVMLSTDLAELYGVPTKALVQAVKRNAARFPPDFMFRLSRDEWTRLRSQFMTLESSRNLRSQSVTSKQTGPRRPQTRSICLFGTRCRDALQRPQQRSRDSGQHPHHS